MGFGSKERKVAGGSAAGGIADLAEAGGVVECGDVGDAGAFEEGFGRGHDGGEAEEGAAAGGPEGGGDGGVVGEGGGGSARGGRGGCVGEQRVSGGGIGVVFVSGEAEGGDPAAEEGLDAGGDEAEEFAELRFARERGAGPGGEGVAGEFGGQGGGDGSGGPGEGSDAELAGEGIEAVAAGLGVDGLGEGEQAGWRGIPAAALMGEFAAEGEQEGAAAGMGGEGEASGGEGGERGIVEVLGGVADFVAGAEGEFDFEPGAEVAGEEGCGSGEIAGEEAGVAIEAVGIEVEGGLGEGGGMVEEFGEVACGVEGEGVGAALIEAVADGGPLGEADVLMGTEELLDARERPPVQGGGAEEALGVGVHVLDEREEVVVAAEGGTGGEAVAFERVPGIGLDVEGEGGPEGVKLFGDGGWDLVDPDGAALFATAGLGDDFAEPVEGMDAQEGGEEGVAGRGIPSEDGGRDAGDGIGEGGGAEGAVQLAGGAADGETDWAAEGEGEGGRGLGVEQEGQRVASEAAGCFAKPVEGDANGEGGVGGDGAGGDAGVEGAVAEGGGVAEVVIAAQNGMSFAGLDQAQVGHHVLLGCMTWSGARVRGRGTNSGPMVAGAGRDSGERGVGKRRGGGR